MDALHSQYEVALKDWQNKYERSERDLAEVRVADNNDHIKLMTIITGEDGSTQHD